MKTTLSNKGTIALPLEIRRREDTELDKEVELSPPRNQGLLEWLLACPEKGFFVPIEPEKAGIEIIDPRD